MTAIRPAPSLTAAQVLLLGALDCSHVTGEFTAARLVVASWKRDRQRFGLKGFESEYPDSHRVLMEVMGRTRRHPIPRGYLVRVRPNVYQLTALGKAEAAQLDGGAVNRSASDLYQTIAALVNHPTFRLWLEDPEQPKLWLQVLGFLAGRFAHPAQQFRLVKSQVGAAIAWCNQRDVAFLLPDGSLQRGVRTEPIPFQRLSELTDFLGVLERRFRQLKAAA